MKHLQIKRQPVQNTESRRGIAVTELALLAPVLAILVVGMCEIGQAARVKTVLSEAVRLGCNTGCRVGFKNNDVTNDVQSAITAAGFPGTSATVTILVNGVAGEVALAVPNDKITVKVSIPTSSVSLTGKLKYMGATQHESATMLK